MYPMLVSVALTLTWYSLKGSRFPWVNSVALTVTFPTTHLLVREGVVA